MPLMIKRFLLISILAIVPTIALAQSDSNSNPDNPDQWNHVGGGWDNNEHNPHHPVPVPEPATYGAVMTAGVLGLIVWKKRKSKKLS
jgi:hypothetical protein